MDSERYWLAFWAATFLLLGFGVTQRNAALVRECLTSGRSATEYRLIRVGP